MCALQLGRRNDFYDPAGPQVFFDGNVMVRTGYHNGVPLYVDATVEPYSVLLVPVGRKLMQPYKRRASRGMVNAAGTPSNPLQPSGPISELAPRAVGTAGLVTTPGARPVDVVGTTVTQPRRGRPVRYDSISVEFKGEKWVMAGPSVPLRTGLVKIAEDGGVPVYAEKDSERQRIYLTFTPGRVVPFTPQP